MSKYIKLEDAIHNINLEVTGRKEYTGDMKANLFFALDDLPTIDIVHCKDCKWRGVQNEPEGTCYYWCRNIGAGFAVDEWNYCCWGERKDNE